MVQNHKLFKQLQFRIPIFSVQSLLFFVPKSIEQQAIHALKYKKNDGIGRYFGELIGKEIKQAPWLQDVDALVPIPLHKSKEIIRGYNQAKIICEGIQKIKMIPSYGALVKKKKGAGATKGNRIQRMNARSFNFEWSHTLPQGTRHLLLVDDVITTGATIESAITEIQKHYSGKISVVSIAHTF